MPVVRRADGDVAARGGVSPNRCERAGMGRGVVRDLITCAARLVDEKGLRRQ